MLTDLEEGLKWCQNKQRTGLSEPDRCGVRKLGDKACVEGMKTELTEGFELLGLPNREAESDSI